MATEITKAEKIYFTVEEVAEYLGLAKATIYDLVHKKKIPIQNHLAEESIFSKQILII